MDPELLGQLLAQAQERGVPISGIVWRSAGPSAGESSADSAARLETEIAYLLSAVHTLQADKGLKLVGGLWIVTERAVATESGERVDPVQSALWGLGRTIINEEPALRCKLVDVDGSEQAVHALAGILGAPMDEPELACGKGSSSRHGCCRGRAAATSPCRGGRITLWRPQSAVRSTTCGSPRLKCRRRTRTTCRCGLRPRV